MCACALQESAKKAEKATDDAEAKSDAAISLLPAPSPPSSAGTGSAGAASCISAPPAALRATSRAAPLYV